MHLPTMHCGLETPRSRSAASGSDRFALSGIFCTFCMESLRLQHVKMSFTNTVTHCRADAVHYGPCVCLVSLYSAEHPVRRSNSPWLVADVEDELMMCQKSVLCSDMVILLFVIFYICIHFYYFKVLVICCL